MKTFTISGYTFTETFTGAWNITGLGVKAYLSSITLVSLQNLATTPLAENTPGAPASIAGLANNIDAILALIADVNAVTTPTAIVISPEPAAITAATTAATQIVTSPAPPAAVTAASDPGLSITTPVTEIILSPPAVITATETTPVAEIISSPPIVITATATTPVADIISSPPIVITATATTPVADIITLTPIVAATPADEFAGVDAAIANESMVQQLDVTGIDSQIAANQRQADIIAEQQTVSQESIAADQAAIDDLVAEQQQGVQAVADPTDEVVQEQLQAEEDAANAAIDDLVAKDQLTVADEPAIDPLAAAQEQVAEEAAAAANNTRTGLTEAKAEAAASSTAIAAALSDWRAKLRLAPSANYLYNAADPGILAPLKQTDGVIFPYTPSIQVNYAAHYDATTLTHSNYKIFQYGSSSVDSVNITCDFTAQDTAEANYLLAVIHFFRTVTKMFYGQDASPNPGTPPPLCYLSGFGAFQFDEHPLAITSFNYSLPVEVDYIRASAAASLPGVSLAAAAVKSESNSASKTRAENAGLSPGAVTPLPRWAMYPTSAEPTYVPTKMQIQISAVPIVTRNDISNDFSVKKYATGVLLQGTNRSGRGGIW